MQIVRLAADTYSELVKDRRVFFNEPAFTELNRHIADEVYYLVAYKGEAPCFGFHLGNAGGGTKKPVFRTVCLPC